MARIFISYKRVDKDKVFHIVEEIKRKTGIDCWIDIEGIEGGDHFHRVIIEAIDNADIVIFMLSQNFIAPYVDERTGKVDLEKQTFPEKEIMYALSENKRLIPLSIDGTSINECKWLKFHCYGLDCIDWGKEIEREKLLSNIQKWSKHKPTDSDDIDRLRPSQNYQNMWDSTTRLLKLHWRKMIIAFPILLLIIGVRISCIPPNQVYISTSGVNKDFALQGKMDKVIMNNVIGIQDSAIIKLTDILCDLNLPRDSVKNILAESGLNHIQNTTSSSNIIVKKIRALFGRKDIDMHIKLSKDSKGYIAEIKIERWDGIIYNKTIGEYNNLKILKKIAAYMTCVYSPATSVLFDYSPIAEGAEYNTQSSPWRESLYTNAEREDILKNAINLLLPDSNFCKLILANHYSDIGTRLYDNMAIEEACKYYNSVEPYVPKYVSNAIKERMSNLNGICELKTDITETPNTLPDRLISEGAIPTNTNCNQLIVVTNQSERWIDGKKRYKATMHTFEKKDNRWTEISSPYEVNTAVKGIATPGKKKEGDLMLPSGFYSIPFAFGYENNVKTKMDFVVLNQNHLWVCDPSSKKYNNMIEDKDGTFKKNPQNEVLRRTDHLYKYAIVINYNVNPIVKGKGSAIFIHVNRSENSNTAGCISISEDKIIELLEWLNPTMNPYIYISKEAH